MKNVKAFALLTLAFVASIASASDFIISLARYEQIKKETIKQHDELVAKKYFIPLIFRSEKFQFERMREEEKGKTSRLWGAMYVDGSDQESLNFVAAALAQGDFRSLLRSLDIEEVRISFRIPEISLKGQEVILTQKADEVGIATADGSYTSVRAITLMSMSMADISKYVFTLVQAGALSQKKIEADYGVKLSDVYYGAARWQADELMKGLGLQFTPAAAAKNYFVSNNNSEWEARLTALKGIAAFKTMAKDGLVYIDHRVHTSGDREWQKIPELKTEVIMTKEELNNTWEKEANVGVYATGTSFQYNLKKAITELEARGYKYNESKQIFEK